MRDRTHDGLVFAVGLGSAMLLAWVVFPAVLYRTVEQPADFDHSLHVGPVCSLPCDHCHGFTPEGRFEGIPSVEVCAQCHDDFKPRVRADRLWRPYSDLPDNAWFPHARHVLAAGLSCEGCHGAHGETESLPDLKINRITGYSRAIWGRDISGITTDDTPGMKMSDCEDCHERNGATTGCQDCHR